MAWRLTGAEPFREGVAVRAGIVSAVLLVGVGTYLMRLLPLVAVRRAQRRADAPVGSPAARWGGWLELVGPAVIAALLATSVVPEPSDPAFWSKLGPGVAALGLTGLVANRWRNLGLTVVAGVAAYGLFSLLS